MIISYFFPKTHLGSEREAFLKNILKAKGYQFLVIVIYQVSKDAIAKHVASTMPVIQQVFIDIRDIEDEEKRLFLARKQLRFYRLSAI
ncbi:hypothetical protein ACVNPX_07915 [Staphylococcus aureus]